MGAKKDDPWGEGCMHCFGLLELLGWGSCGRAGLFLESVLEITVDEYYSRYYVSRRVVL